jgi:hypothetical protein
MSIAASVGDWGAISRRIRRAAPGAGHARVRGEDGGLWVVGEAPFPGAEPVAPRKALVLLAVAIEHGAPAKHATRYLGACDVQAEPRRWQRIRGAQLSLPRAREVATALDATCTDLPRISGYGWRFPTNESAELYYAALRRVACPGIPTSGPSCEDIGIRGHGTVRGGEPSLRLPQQWPGSVPRLREAG